MARTKDATSTQQKEKKGEKTAAKKSAKASTTKPKAGLSEERVVDSASEDDAPKKAVEPAKKTKEKSTSRSKAAPPPPRPTKPPTPESSDDESEDESEDSDEDEDAEMVDAPVLKKPSSIPPKVNGVKRKAEEDVSSLGDEESTEDSDSESSEEPMAKRAKTAAVDNGSKDSSEEESSSEDEEEEEDDADESAAAAPPKPAQPSATATSARESIPAQPFVPPRGSSALSITGSLFSEGTFAGKQIWHITAPKAVPFQSIKQVALDAVQSGATVIHHKGTDYTLGEQKRHTNDFDGPSVPSNDEFDTSSHDTVKTLHLQQKIVLPNLGKKQADTNTGSNAAADIAQPAVSDVRPQPKGLRMRYKPAGFGASDPGLGSDSDEDGNTSKSTSSKFQFPKTLGAHGSGRPQEGDTNATQKTKKSKKKQRDSDIQTVNGTSQASPPAATEELSKEEWKKRKAEKKARKEAKAAAVAA